MNDEKKGKTPQNKSGVGAGIGLVFGTGIGTTFGLIFGEAIFGDAGTGLTMGLGLGAGIGLTFGAAFGSNLGKQNDNNESTNTTD